MSFSVSLERIYELFIKTILFKKHSNGNQIEEYWKALKNQSERQFGAFCTFYFSETNEIWEIINKMVEFRNNVIHKGMIASKDETVLYAEYVTELLSKLIVLLRTDYLDSVKELSKERFEKIQIQGKELAKVKEVKFEMYKIRSSLNWLYAIPKPIDFAEALRIHTLVHSVCCNLSNAFIFAS